MKGLENNSLQACTLPDFVNKVLLESRCNHSFVHYVHFCVTTKELSTCDKNYITYKAKTFTPWHFM